MRDAFATSVEPALVASEPGTLETSEVVVARAGNGFLAGHDRGTEFTLSPRNKTRTYFTRRQFTRVGGQGSTLSIRGYNFCP